MEITGLLSRVHQGDAEALKQVVPMVYDELKRLAASHLRHERGGATIQTTVLVHEALACPNARNRAHFYGIASRAMRQVLS
jgi:hypothetical protein